MTLGNEQKNIREQIISYVNRETGSPPLQMTMHLPAEFNQFMIAIADPTNATKPWRPQDGSGKFPFMPGYDGPIS